MPGQGLSPPTTRASDRPRAAAAAGRDATAAVTAACLTAVTACLVVLVLSGGLVRAVADGLPDAGGLTRWGLPLAGLLTNLAAVGTVGSLLVGAALLPARENGGLSDIALRAVTAARSWSAAWAVFAVAQLLLTVSDIAAVPVGRLDVSGLVRVLTSSQGTAVAAAVLVASVVVVVSGRARTPTSARVLLLVAVAGLLPSAATGHVSSAVDHDVAVSAMVVHVVAATLWTGGLVGLALHLRDRPPALAVAAGRFSVLALVAYVALAGSGVLAVLTHLGASSATWSSSYGVIVLLKATALAGLGVVGAVHRRRTVPRLVDAGGGPFLRLAAFELLVMGIAMGLATALSRTPAPPAVAAAPAHGTGHPSLPGVIEPFSIVELTTAWRPNAVVVVLLGVALSTYAVGVRRVRRSGADWPRARTVAFASGVLVALVDLCSGVATYAPAMVSVQVSQLLVALLVVPALLLLGAPAQLAAQVGPDVAPIARLVAQPLTGAAVSCALLVAIYRTPLIELSLRSSWVHLLVLAAAVCSGLLLLWPVLGAEVADRAALHAEWVWSIAGLAGCLAVLGAQLRYGDRLMAGAWFVELRWSWVDPVADQRVAGGVVALAAASVLGLALLPIGRVSRRAARS